MKCFFGYNGYMGCVMEFKKVLFLLFFLSIFISFASATIETLGTFKEDSCVELSQICANCTYNNVSSVTYPNSSLALSNVAMTKDNTYYGYTFCNANVSGEYIVTGFGDPEDDKTIWTYNFFVTPNGEASSTATTTAYVGSAFLLLIFLIFSIIGIFKVKHYAGSFALYWVAHLLFIALSFVLWNGSEFLLVGHPFFAGFFRIVWWFAIGSMVPMFFLSLAWIFYTHLATREMEKLIDGGMSPEEAFTRTKRRKGGILGEGW